MLDKHGEMPAELAPLAAKLSDMWRDGAIDDAALLDAKVTMWGFLEAKHANSVTIADAEDRTVRAALALAEHPSHEHDIADNRDWVLEMFPQAAV